MWPMMDKPRLWRRRSDKGSIGFAASYCTFCAQDLRAPPCTRTPQEGARCGCARYATGRKVVLSEGLVRTRKRHRACVGSLHMENKELPELAGPQSAKSRVPVLRAAGGGDGETALDTLRLKSLAAAPPPPPIEQSDWQRYLTAALRHKWLVLAVTLVGTALGIVGTRFLDPRYSDKAILWVDVAVGRDRGVPSDEILDSKGWLDLVTSNAVLDTVVKQRRLFLQPATPDDSAPLSSFDITDRVAPGKYRLIVDKAGRAVRLELEDGTVVQRGRVGQPIGDTDGWTERRGWQHGDAAAARHGAAATGRATPGALRRPGGDRDCFGRDVEQHFVGQGKWRHAAGVAGAREEDRFAARLAVQVHARSGAGERAGIRPLATRASGHPVARSRAGPGPRRSRHQHEATGR